MQRPVLRKQKKQEEYSKHRVEDLWVKPLDLIELCNQGRFFFFLSRETWDKVLVKHFAFYPLMLS